MNQRALETLINLIWQSGNGQRSPIDSDPTARLERQQQIRGKKGGEWEGRWCGKGEPISFQRETQLCTEKGRHFWLV